MKVKVSTKDFPHVDMEKLSDDDRDALLKKIQQAYETLPDGWKKNTESGSAPYVHDDGRLSWKHPGRDQIYEILQTAAGQFPEATNGDGSVPRGSLKRLRMMVKNGVPLAAVHQRARLEGVDPALILGYSQEDEQSAVKKIKLTKKDPISKYRKMLKAGLPIAAIQQRAMIDGVHLDEATLLQEEGAREDASSPAPSVAHNTNDNDKENQGVNNTTVISPLFQPSATNPMVVEFVPQTDLARLVTKMVQTISKRPSSNNNNNTLVADVTVLYHALGAFCGVQQQADMYNSTMDTDMSDTEARARRKPFLELMSSLGMSPPTEWGMEVCVQGLDELIRFIETKFQDEICEIDTNIKVGMYDFDSLAQVYRPGTRVVAKNSFAGGVEMICEVAWNRYEQGRTLFGVSKTFKVCFQFLVAVGKHFTICEFVETMQSFDGRRSTKQLSFVPLQAYSDAEAANLTERFMNRGKLYSKVATNATFMAYDKGTFFAKRTASGGGTDQMAALHASGRMIVDTEGSYEAGHTLGTGYDPMVMGIKYKYKEYMLHMRSQKEGTGSSGDSGDMVLFDTVPTYYLDMTWPAVIGFSFTSKAWGDVLVDGLSEVKFQENIFDNLVLSASRKRMVKALVKHSSDAFNDIVIGKGEGSVFLLYGPPGCGKTLTAEAICEMLHKPLYSVSLGQLGTKPAELEKHLAEILKLCGRWDALILLDEADIFLEKRSSKGSLERNAMVSVMLRLVEYFKGVLFLTSNRVDSLDPAFKTRITLALRYEHLDHSARNQVWRNLLLSSGYGALVDNGSVDTNELAKNRLNGREIKNAIRLGMALAQEDEKPLSQHVLNETVEILNEFNRHMVAAESDWEGHQVLVPSMPDPTEVEV